MNQTTKIQLIKKHLGADTDQWTVTSCLVLLKDHDKLKKANRIELLAEIKPTKIITDGDTTMVTCPKFDEQPKKSTDLDDLL